MSRRTWAYLAAGWAAAFAAPHVYWAAGPTSGLGTALSDDIVGEAGAGMQIACAAIALFCLAGTVTALATLRSWPQHRQPAARRTLVALAWFGAALLVLRSIDIYVEFDLGLTGLRHVPAERKDNFLHLARWFSFFWLPVFVSGAVAWTGFAVSYTRSAPSAPPARPVGTR